jgi:hypothetical protein
MRCANEKATARAGDRRATMLRGPGGLASSTPAITLSFERGVPLSGADALWNARTCPDQCDPGSVSAFLGGFIPWRDRACRRSGEIGVKQARSIKSRMTIARLPLAQEGDAFSFEDTPVHEALVRDLTAGEYLDQRRDIVLIGGTGTGKFHLAVSISRA